MTEHVQVFGKGRRGALLENYFRKAGLQIHEQAKYSFFPPHSENRQQKRQVMNPTHHLFGISQIAIEVIRKERKTVRRSCLHTSTTLHHFTVLL